MIRNGLICVGGRNLVLNSANFMYSGSDSGGGAQLMEKGKITVLTDGQWNTYNNGVPVSGYFNEHKGKYFTLSGDIKVSNFKAGGTGIRFGISLRQSVPVRLDSACEINGNMNWRRLYTTVYCPTDWNPGNNPLYFLFDIYPVTYTNPNHKDVVIEYRNIKMEYGNVPTDYTPAVEEMFNS